MKKSSNWWFLIFVMPTFLAFAIAFFIPFLTGFILSFTEFRTVTDAQFVGITNYIRIFKESEDFLNAFFFTFKFSVFSVISVNFFAFVLALILTREIKGTKFFRTVFFMPNLIGGIVLGYIWQVILNGILYNFSLSLTSKPIFGFLGLLILMNWQMIGYTMIIYIAGLSNISNDILEAAKVDGADSFTVLRKITIPSIMPSINICLFITVTNSFKLFDQNLALTAGAPSNKTQMLALDIYNTFYSRIGFEGVGQAKAVIFFLIVALIAFIQLKFTRGREVEN